MRFERRVQATKRRFSSKWPFSMALIGCACSNLVAVELDTLPDTVDQLGLLFESPAGLVETTALVMRTGGSFRPEVDDDAVADATGVEAIGFETETLAAYDAPTGPTTARLEPWSLGRGALPLPDFAARGKWDGSSSSLDQPGSQQRLTVDWLPSCPKDACEAAPMGTIKQVRLPHTQDDVILVDAEWSADAYLAVTASHGFFEVTEREAVPLTRLSTSTVFRAADMSREHGGWLLSAHNIVHFDAHQLEERLSLADLPSTALDRVEIVVSKYGPLEVFVSTSAGVFLRFDGERAEMIDHGVTVDPSDSDTDLAWISPGKVVALFSGGNAVVTYDQGVVSVNQTLTRPRSIGYDPSLGVLVGTDSRLQERSALYRLEGDRLVHVEDGPEGGAVIASIWPAGHGFFFGGVGGAMLYYAVGLGTCFPQTYAAENIRALHAGPRGIIFSTTATVDPEATVYVAALRNPSVHPSCW